VLEKRQYEVGIVFTDGVVADLESWGGGCIADECVAVYELIVPRDIETIDDGYPLMIWLLKQVSPPEAKPSQWEVIDAESVGVPPSVAPAHGCHRPDLEADSEVIALTAVDGNTPLWAWKVSLSTGITPIDPEQITCDQQ
jgi:hypothetical protein